MILHAFTCGVILALLVVQLILCGISVLHQLLDMFVLEEIMLVGVVMFLVNFKDIDNVWEEENKIVPT